MELDLALAARRAVASMSDITEWLTLKIAISMTTPRYMCACPLELALELTDCRARAHDFGITEGECLHFEPSQTFHPLPLWMELDLALAAHREVA